MQVGLLSNFHDFQTLIINLLPLLLEKQPWGELVTETMHRHHYVVLWFQGTSSISMKFDCRLVALVPLSQEDHNKMLDANEAKKYEAYFMEVMEKLMNGEWATPHWWAGTPEGEDAIVSFEENLERLGYVRPS